MGLDAEVVCIGHFSKDIVPYLDYEPDTYENVIEGVGVAATFFRCNTTQTSHELADALGVDARDFNTHHIRKDLVKWDALEEMCEENPEWDYGIEGFKTLLEEKGFVCIYLPSG